LVASSHGSCDKDVPINVKRVTTRILLVVYHMHVFLGQGFPAKFLNSQKNTTNALTPIILHCTVLVLQVFCFCFAGLLVQNNLKLENYRIEHGPRRFLFGGFMCKIKRTKSKKDSSIFALVLAEVS